MCVCGGPHVFLISKPAACCWSTEGRVEPTVVLSVNLQLKVGAIHYEVKQLWVGLSLFFVVQGVVSYQWFSYN